MFRQLRLCACFGFHSSATASSVSRLTQLSADFLKATFQRAKVDFCSRDRTRKSLFVFAFNFELSVSWNKVDFHSSGAEKKARMCRNNKEESLLAEPKAGAQCEE